MTLSPLSIIHILIIFILLLFTVLLFHVGRHTKSNRYLGIYFISQILVLSIYVLTRLSLPLFYPLLSIQFAWGAFFYLFICSLLDPAFQFRLKNLGHFIPAFLIFFFLLFSHEPSLSNNLKDRFPLLFQYLGSGLMPVFNSLIIGYNIAAILKYYQYKAKVKNNPRLANKVPAVWLKIALWGFVISCTLFQAGNQLNHSISDETFNWEIVGNTAFLIYFCILFYVAVVSRTLIDRFDGKDKYKNSNLGESEALQLILQLDHLMSTQKLYANPNLKLKECSDVLKTSERYLSQVVNEHKQQNFSDYLNSYRIKHAMNLLADPSLKEKTILWVLFEAGFNSKSSFNTIFKKVAGCTPAEYRKNAIQQTSA